LTLRHSTVRRVLERRPASLILTRKPQLEIYQVHDQLTVVRNQRRRSAGRHDQLEDPLIFTVAIQSVVALGLVELDQLLVRSAGFQTTEDFFLDWLSGHRRIDVRAEVFVCGFTLVEDARFLHERISRGYTPDPARSVRGEPQALGRGDLESLRRSEEHRREVRSLANRLREAGHRRDVDGLAAVRQDLGVLEAALRTGI
jgi:hypothetical protein